MQPLPVNSRTPRVIGENGAGAALPASITLSVGSVRTLLLKPLAIVIVHSPRGKVTTALYSPGLLPGTTSHFALSPPAVVARTLGCNPGSKVLPCCRTANVSGTGFPATA